MTALMTATNRPQLEQAHTGLADWLDRRYAGLEIDLAEARNALALAKERKWATDAPARTLRRLRDHLAFLEKVRGAVKAGYTIVPNFNLNAIAVRVAKEPGRSHQESQPQIGAARLPTGEGDFVSPEPYFESWTIDRPNRDGKGTHEVTIYRATGNAPVEVPFVLMKRQLADALHAAMESKLFDEIGIVQDAPRGDPVLVGHIRHPRAAGRWDTKGATFFIGWWFDPTTLDF